LDDSGFSFSKYHGTGNDFILIDNREETFPLHENHLKNQCHRQYGIGADGIVLLQNSKKADFKMRYFNADGKEAAMCGNGLRCFIHFLQKLGNKSKKFLIETQNTIYPCTIDKRLVTISMGQPKWIEKEGHLSLEKEKIDYSYLDTGVPHLVIFVKDLLSPSFLHTAQLLRHHQRFSPEGVNVNFAKIENQSLIGLRTYERGVEGETRSCGTGALAAAIVGKEKFKMETSMEVKFLSQEKLKFDLIDGIYMSGLVTHVFDGTLYDSFSLSQ